MNHSTAAADLVAQEALAGFLREVPVASARQAADLDRRVALVRREVALVRRADFRPRTVMPTIANAITETAITGGMTINAATAVVAEADLEAAPAEVGAVALVMAA